MRKVLLLIYVWITFGLYVYSQEVQFAPALISSGGSFHSDGAVNISRWRIGQINVITLPSDENGHKLAKVNNTIMPSDSPAEWSVILFPNPVKSKLNIRFDMEDKGEFAFEIFDLTGRKIIAEKAGIFFPGQVTELDFSELAPALYLLKIIPSGEGSISQFKITKQ